MSTSESTARKRPHLEYLLTAYVFGDISPAGRVEVETHLESCAECREELEELRGALGQVNETVGGETYSFEARRLDRVLAAAKEKRRKRWIFGRWPALAAAVLVVGVVGVLGVQTLGVRGRRNGLEVASAPAASHAPGGRGSGARDGKRFVEEFAPGLHPTRFNRPEKEARVSGGTEFSQVGDSLADVAASSPASPKSREKLKKLRSMGYLRGNVEEDVREFTPLEEVEASEDEEKTFSKAQIQSDQNGNVTVKLDGNRDLTRHAQGFREEYKSRANGKERPARRTGQKLGKNSEVVSVDGEASDWPLEQFKSKDAPESEAAAKTLVTNGLGRSWGWETQGKAGGDGPEEILARKTKQRKRLSTDQGRNPLSLSTTDKREGLVAEFDWDGEVDGPTDEQMFAAGTREQDNNGMPGPVDDYGLSDESGRGRNRSQDHDGPPGAPEKNETLRELRQEAKKPATVAGSRSAGTSNLDGLIDVNGRLDTDTSALIDLENLKKQLADLKANKAAATNGRKVAGGGAVAGRELRLERGVELGSLDLVLGDDRLSVGGEPASPSAEVLVPPGASAPTPSLQSQSLHRRGRVAVQQSEPLTTANYGPQDPDTSPAFIFGGRFPFANGRTGHESRLRAFRHYCELDPTLTVEQFAIRSLDIPAPAVGDEGLGQEGFRKRYGVHPFVDTSRDPFSTFGMDVDTASYTLARNNIRSGRLPDPKTVRTEEFINNFGEEFSADPDAVFSVFSEGAPSPFGEGLDLLKIAVKARELHPLERKDAVLTFAIDTSGSMNLENRLALVRQALETLVRALEPGDRVGIVAFGAHPYLVLPHTPARERQRILGAIRSLAPGGGTNVEAGLDLAYRIADEVMQKTAVNRVVLCSDGVANVGPSGPEEVLQKVKVYARRGIYLSSVGFGMGKYNDEMLETLARNGNGNYAYVDGIDAAAEIFQTHLPSTLQVLAADAKIQVDFNPDVVSHYRLLGYENRDIADVDFRNDKKDAGEVGPGSTVTVLYEIRRKSSSSGDLGRIYLRYRDTGTGRVDEANYPLTPGVLATRLEDSSDRFRFIACVAEAAELLRNSYWARNGTYTKVIQGLHTLSPEYRARPEWNEFTDLVTRAQALTISNLTNQ